MKRKSSDYWNWVFKHNKTNEEGEYVESTEANPDLLTDPVYPWDYDKDAEQEDYVKEIFQQIRFSPMEVKVIKGLMKGLSEQEIAKSLKVKRFTISSIRYRLKKKIRKVVCQNPDFGASVRGIIEEKGE